MSPFEMHKTRSCATVGSICYKGRGAPFYITHTFSINISGNSGDNTICLSTLTEAILFELNDVQCDHLKSCNWSNPRTKNDS